MNLVEIDNLKIPLTSGSSDEKAVREVVEKKSYLRREFQIAAGERWLDLGGNVGAFTVFSLKGSVCHDL